MIVYCATTNGGKIAEFRIGVERIHNCAVSGLAKFRSPEETGVTFEENAVRKLYYGEFTEGLVLPEDSGLAVDVLGGEPGVYSARYASPGRRTRPTTVWS